MAMRLVVCSLKTGGPQLIPPSSTDYVIVRFPFNGESDDKDGLHDIVQPDTHLSTSAGHPRAGLIWPLHTAWATLNGLMYWDHGDYTEIRSRFIRDPLRLTTGYDSTATEDDPPSVGGQYKIKSWNMWVHPMTPVALAVRHNSDRDQVLNLAEFKVSYWVNEV